MKTSKLKAHLSAYLKRVRRGERVVVLDRDVPVAEILPLSAKETAFSRLAREGKCRPPTRGRRGLEALQRRSAVVFEDYLTDDAPLR